MVTCYGCGTFNYNPNPNRTNSRRHFYYNKTDFYIINKLGHKEHIDHTIAKHSCCNALDGKPGCTTRRYHVEDLNYEQ